MKPSTNSSDAYQTFSSTSGRARCTLDQCGSAATHRRCYCYNKNIRDKRPDVSSESNLLPSDSKATLLTTKPPQFPELHSVSHKRKQNILNTSHWI
ncbi:hypothetical protein EVAR_57655_1 [Eumeta japonica]|uniref:Uncharacterized protein n=1 Tax=Eumeta variegata TaxID=151549 RepID=A0A4C1YV91_EUMVA|nr:hypothetical protein EVAR_57655_1 [Eumeta japonica]